MNYVDASYEGNGYMYMMMNENYKTFHMKNPPSMSLHRVGWRENDDAD